jgi:hypothetical protein
MYGHEVLISLQYKREQSTLVVIDFLTLYVSDIGFSSE